MTLENFKTYCHFHPTLVNLSEELYAIFLRIEEAINKRLIKTKKEQYNEEVLVNYLLEEIEYSLEEYSSKNLKEVLLEKSYQNQIAAIVFDKFFFNELNPYHAVSLVNQESPIISTIDLM